MSVTCIVLDGFHKGETAILPSAPPILNLYRPPTVTTCECNPDSYYETDVSGARIDSLKLAFRSIDGATALYSTDGKSSHILNRGWIMRKGGGNFYRDNELIHVHCRDERAWDQP